MFRRILHASPLDDSGTLAFRLALSLAVANRASLDIVHVFDPHRQAHDFSRFPSVRGQLSAWGLLPADAEEAAVRRETGVQVTKAELPSRHPIDAIAHYCDSHDIDLIVLANSAKEGVRRWLKPSVSESVARRLRAPCFFVPQACRELVDDTGRYQPADLLVPALSDADFSAMDNYAKRFTANLVSEPVTTRFTAPETAADAEIPGQIVAAADQSDLIMMVRQGDNTLADALSGSTTERVVHLANCPVLVLAGH